MIGMGIFRALKRTGAGLKASACASGFLVLSYGVMTGFGPSTQRAVIMFLVRMGAVYSGYQYDFLSAVGLAALILFITQPLSILQTGVWFSFAAILSIGLLWPAIERSIPWQFQKTKNYKMQHLKKAMGIKMSNRERIEGILRYMGPSLAVTIGTVPLTAFCYGAIPLVSFFLNLIVLPLMTILMPMAMAAGWVSVASEYVACFLGGSVHSILQMNRWLCCKMLAFPLAVWRTGVPPVTWIVTYYVILTAFCLLSCMESDWWQRWKAGKKLEKNKWLILMICLFILIPIRKWQPMIAFIDVGQGDGIFMRTDNGTTWLIDGGSSSVKELGKYRLLPFMNYYGEDGIDYACITHSDLDHISGIRELLQEKKIRHLVMTEVSKTDAASCELVALARKAGTQIIYVTQGSRWISGGWQFACVYPGNTVSNDNINDQSMVLLVRAGNQSFLMTGDVTEEAEKVMELQQMAKIDILKVAHHGSKYSSGESFLKATGAKIAIISCGAENRYGHPAPETLERLREQKMQIYLTMTHGAIIMPYKNGRFLLQTWLK